MNEKKLLNAFFAIALAILLLPVWYYQYFPSIDGASHVADAINIKRLITNTCQITKQLFILTPYPVPNWFSYAAIGLLSFVFPLYICEKIIVTAIILMLALVFRRILTRQNPSNLHLPVLALIFVYNQFLFSGNYNFLLSLCFCFMAISWWDRRRADLSLKNFIILFLIFGLLYFSHAFGFMAFCLSLLVMQTLRTSLGRFIKSGFFCLGAALPWLCCFYLYYAAPKAIISGTKPLIHKLGIMLTPFSLLSLGNAETLLIIFAAVIFWLLVYHGVTQKFKNRKLGDYDHYGIIALTLFLIGLVIPSSFAGGWPVEPRLQFVIFLFALAWLSQFNIPSRMRILLGTAFFCALVYSVSLKLNYFENYNSFNNDMAEIAKNVEEGKTILNIDLASPLLGKTDKKPAESVLFSITPYFVAQKCLAETFNFQAAETNTFPLSYKPSKHPKNLGQFRTYYGFPIMPPLIDLTHYNQSTGQPIDYILLYGSEELLYHYDSASGYNEIVQYNNMMHQIDSGYQLIYSDDGKLLKLYARRK